MKHRAALFCGLISWLLSACTPESHEQSAPLAIAPDKVFLAYIQKTHGLKNAEAQAWLDDISSALNVVKTPRSNESICAVMAVIEQESGYKEDPPVAGLSQLVEKKITNANTLALRVALQLRLEQAMSTGKSFREGLKLVKTERDLTNWYNEFTESRYTAPILKYMGKSVDDLVATVGSMQVSVDYAREVASSLGQSSGNVRDTLYTRRGGVLFGTAHLFYYPAHYQEMIYRFADFNAGHYASRNAGFQTMVAQLSGKVLVADGDLIEHSSENTNQVSKTQSALMQLFAKRAPQITVERIKADLQHEKLMDFEQTQTYQTVAQLYQQKYQTVIAQKLPSIALKSEKITRKLTTEWYANSVNRRYQSCLGQAQRAL